MSSNVVALKPSEPRKAYIVQKLKELIEEIEKDDEVRAVLVITLTGRECVNTLGVGDLNRHELVGVLEYMQHDIMMSPPRE